MSQEKNTNKVTAGNVIAIIGLAIIAVFTFLGHAYKSGGEIGWDIIIALVITAITAFLLWFLIKAKGAKEQLDKWRKVEYITLAVYIVFAVVASYCGGFLHFFAVNGNKAEMKEYAKADIKMIDGMIDDYKDFQREAVEQTGTGLRNATASGQRCDSELNSFMDENNISHNQESAKAFENIQRRPLLGNSFDTYYQDIKSQEDDITSAVDSWSVMQIPAKAKQIEEMSQAVSKELTRLSTNAKLPKIEENPKTHTYTIVTYQRKVYKPKAQFQFRKQLQESGSVSFLGVLLMLIANVMVLFCYYVASRKEASPLPDLHEHKDHSLRVDKPKNNNSLSDNFINDNSIPLN